MSERWARSGSSVPCGSCRIVAAYGCPYRGLLPFEEDDEEVFYGPERLTTELAVRLARQMTLGGVVGVTGASEAGKSSLLRAGLLPTLARGVQLKGSERWSCRVIMPTKDPLTELATALAVVAATPPQPGPLVQSSHHEPLCLVAVARRSAAAAGLWSAAS